MDDTKCVELPCGRVAQVLYCELPFISTAADACINHCSIWSDCRVCNVYNMAREAEEPTPSLEERFAALENTVKRLEESIRKTAMQSYINSGEYEP